MSDIDYRSCRDVFARLDDWVDRELAPDDIEQIERHLEICAMCADEFRIERGLLVRLRATLRRIEMPEGLEARVWQRLRDMARDERADEPGEDRG